MNGFSDSVRRLLRLADILVYAVVNEMLRYHDCEQLSLS